MIRLEMKDYNMILTEKQQKYQHYHQVKVIKVNILQVKKYCLLIKDKTEQAKFTYFPLGKAFKKQKKAIKEQEQKQMKTIEDQGEKQKRHLKTKSKKNF